MLLYSDVKVLHIKTNKQSMQKIGPLSCSTKFSFWWKVCYAAHFEDFALLAQLIFVSSRLKNKQNIFFFTRAQDAAYCKHPRKHLGP